MTAIEARRNGCIGAAIGCLLLLAAACARSFEESGSGETHFLSTCSSGCGSELSCLGALCTRACDDSEACSGLGQGASCEAPSIGASDGGTERVCDRLCTRDRDCDALGAGFACTDGRCRVAQAEDSGLATPEMRCRPGCVGVHGYAEDPARGCVDRTQIGFVGCDCNPNAAFPHCGRRASDDSLWVFSAGELGAEAGFAACTPEESDRMVNACEFADCAVQPLSLCTLEATCADRGCNNLEFDARGCRRMPCTSDAECSDDERCVPLTCVTTSWCTVADPGPGESCGCGGVPACRRGAACNPVATVGPAGAWQSLELVEVHDSCLGGCGRTVDASGVITISIGRDETRAGMLSEDDRATLAQIIDGPTLRAGLRDGFECGTPLDDSAVLLRLDLPGERLEGEVAPCVAGYAPDEHEVARLYQLLGAY